MHEEFFDVLKKDHDEVKDILDKLEDTDEKAGKTREKLFNQLKQEFVPHMKAEEKAFYSILKEKEEIREEILESFEEHHVAELVFNELDKLDKGDERWAAKLSVFRELVEHHVEEEEDNLFESAEELLDHDQMQAILKNFQQEKENIKKKLS